MLSKRTDRYFQGDPWNGLYCINAGTVALRRTNPQGHSILVRLGHAGQTVGYRALFHGGVHSVTAEVVQAATICHISGDFLRGALARNPQLVQRYLNQLSGDLDTAEDVLLRQSALPVRARLVFLLLSFKDRFGQVDGGVHGDLVIALPLARQDLEAMLGTTPETVARTIADLHADGVVRFDGRRAIVNNVDTLLDEIVPVSA